MLTLIPMFGIRWFVVRPLSVALLLSDYGVFMCGVVINEEEKLLTKPVFVVSTRRRRFR